MTVVSELTLAVGILTLLLWLWNQFSKNKELYKKIPGPPTLPLVGNALDFGSTAKVITTLQRYTERYGGIVKVQIGPIRKVIVLTDYRFIESILSSNKMLTKSEDYDFFRPWLGTGLLTSDGHKWKTHRRILTPAFHFQILEQFVEIYEVCGKRLVEKLGKEVGKQSVDIYPFVTLCTLDIICESTMGVSVNAQDDEQSEYVKSVKAMTRIVVERALSPVQMYDMLYPLTKNYYAQKKALKVLHGQSNSVITQKRDQLKGKHSDVEVPDDEFKKKKKAFLDVLVDSRIDGKPLTQEEVREEVDTFMFEGHDTTASALSFCLYSLANHPDVQAKVIEEQQMLFSPNDDPQITYADLQNMKYLEQVVKETLRLYPSVPLYLREITEDIEHDGIKLPLGDTAMIYAYGIQRDPKYFTNPDEFNPDRFDDMDGRLPYAFVPFSAGPRNCIGQKFAMLEIKSTVSQILRKYELKPATPRADLKLVVDSVLKSADGIKISLELRK